MVAVSSSQFRCESCTAGTALHTAVQRCGNSWLFAVKENRHLIFNISFCFILNVYSERRIVILINVMTYILRVSGLSKETGLISGSFFSSSSCFFCSRRLGTMPVSTSLWNNSFMFNGNVGAGAGGFSTGSAS